MTIRSESPLSYDKIFDSALELKDAYLVAASAAAQVDSAAKIVDLGSGKIIGDIIIDVTAVEIDSNNEIYDIVAQVSDSASFASGIKNVCQLNMAATEVADGGAADAETGRYILPFRNVFNGAQYRYLRLYTKVAGTIATGINYSAFLTKGDSYPG